MIAKKEKTKNHRDIPEVERAIQKYQNLHIFLEKVYQDIMTHPKRKSGIRNMKKLQKDLSKILQLILSTDSIFSASSENLEEICTRIDAFLVEFKKGRKKKVSKKVSSPIKSPPVRKVLLVEEFLQKIKKRKKLEENSKKTQQKRKSERTKTVKKKSRKYDHFMRCVIEKTDDKKEEVEQVIHHHEAEIELKIACNSCFQRPLKTVEDKPVLISPCNHFFCSPCFNYWIRDFQIAQVRKSCPVCDSTIRVVIRELGEIIKKASADDHQEEATKLSYLYPGASKENKLLTRHHIIDKTQASINKIRRKYDRRLDKVIRKRIKMRRLDLKKGRK